MGIGCGGDGGCGNRANHHGGRALADRAYRYGADCTDGGTGHRNNPAGARTGTYREGVCRRTVRIPFSGFAAADTTPRGGAHADLCRAAEHLTNAHAGVRAVTDA